MLYKMQNESDAAGFDFMAKEEALETQFAPARREAASALAADLLFVLMDAVRDDEGNSEGIDFIAA